MLQFDAKWRFASPGPVQPVVVQRFRELIDRMCAQGQRQGILEEFKSHFAAAAGRPYYHSSNEDWASTDLDGVMHEAATNAPVFIAAFYDGCAELRRHCPDMAMPPLELVNRVLSDAGTGFQIDPPALVATSTPLEISLPDQTPSLDEQAQVLIETAMQASDRALGEGNGRQAVQELLWLLETISTAFRSPGILDGTIHGRYFNKIIGQLRRRERGHQDQILRWMMSLHGYLSSPTGGGVRHGVDLNEGLELGINESRLYCNLIRSYLRFLIDEHDRLSRQGH